MAVRKSLEIWLCVDDDGNYEVGGDRSEASDRFNDNVGGTGPLRVVHINVKLALPQVEKATVEVADDDGEIQAQAAE